MPKQSNIAHKLQQHKDYSQFNKRMSSHIGIGGDKVHTRMVSHPCCRDCMEQWEKLDVAKKRLALKQERLELDQALVKAEKRNLKKNSKLAAKGGPGSGSGGRRSHSVDCRRSC